MKCDRDVRGETPPDFPLTKVSSSCRYPWLACLPALTTCHVSSSTQHGTRMVVTLQT